MSRDPLLIGLDIGGANLKYCRSDGVALHHPFALWLRPEALSETIFRDLSSLCDDPNHIAGLAVSMTGELADCFVDRAAGVTHIVEQTVLAADRMGINKVSFYGVDGCFHHPSAALDQIDQIAAANWHALASFVGKRVVANALLIDVGSTTTDIIPIADGRVATTAKTDFDRLQEGSLVYVGCRRTPVCALVDSLTHRGSRVRVMNEVFATIDDARLLMGSTAEDPQDCDSADQKPRTRLHAANRLARMIGLDRRNCTLEQAKQLALQVFDAAKQEIADATVRLDTGESWILSGHGQDLVQASRSSTVLSLSDQLEDSVVRCAPAYAVACLLASQCNHSPSGQGK